MTTGTDNLQADQRETTEDTTEQLVHPTVDELFPMDNFDTLTLEAQELLIRQRNAYQRVLAESEEATEQVDILKKLESAHRTSLGHWRQLNTTNVNRLALAAKVGAQLSALIGAEVTPQLSFGCNTATTSFACNDMRFEFVSDHRLRVIPSRSSGRRPFEFELDTHGLPAVSAMAIAHYLGVNGTTKRLTDKTTITPRRNPLASVFRQAGAPVRVMGLEEVLDTFFGDAPRQ